jgi:beta-keto acid cleavage enzyme
VGLSKACLNGAREPGEHPALPLTPAQLAADGAAAVAAGAQALHIHPRDAAGRETLDVDDAVRAMQAACPGVPVGVWIEPDLAARVAAVRALHAPAMASVNLSEAGHVEVMAALEQAGVGIEAGTWHVSDVAALRASGFAGRLVRVLIEPGEEDPAAALANAQAIDAALDAAGIAAPRVFHGFGSADLGGRRLGQGAWPGLADRPGGHAHAARRNADGGQRRARQRRAGALTSGGQRAALAVALRERRARRCAGHEVVAHRRCRGVIRADVAHAGTPGAQDLQLDRYGHAEDLEDGPAQRRGRVQAQDFGVAARRCRVEVGHAPHAAVDVLAPVDPHRGEDPWDRARGGHRVGHA